MGMHLQVIFGVELEPVNSVFRARTLVMEMRGRGRGRGGFRGGRGGSRGMLRNIKHQSHCKELERIRERGREMRERERDGAVYGCVRVSDAIV